MLDRLVYILFFVFIGSGLFLVYQGLKGMGYLDSMPTIMQAEKPKIQVKPVDAEQISQNKETPVELDELLGVAFMVRYLPKDEVANGCEYFKNHLERFHYQKGQVNINLLIEEVDPLFENFMKFEEVKECSLQVLRKVLSTLEDAKGFDWGTPHSARFLANALEVLHSIGAHGTSAGLFDQVGLVLKRKPPEFSELGWKIEQDLCFSLKVMGRQKECPHLYPIFDSPSMQLYTLAVRMEYEENWRRLKIYFERMRKYKNVGRWVGYADYLSGLYAFHVKRNYENAMYDFSRASRKRRQANIEGRLAKYEINYLRALHKLGRDQKANEHIDTLLSEVRDSENSSYPGMLFILQKMIAQFRLGTAENVADLKKQLIKISPKDAFSDHVMKAFEALAKKDPRYKAPFANPELQEVEAVLTGR